MDSAKKKDAILDAATRLFLEKGFGVTSTNEVCIEANISKPSLYHFFKSKRHLFYSCHARGINRNLDPFLAQASTIADPIERIQFMIRGFTKNICQTPELRIMIHETLTLKDQYFEKIRVAWKKHYLLLKETIAELQDKDLIAAEFRPSRAALLILGMMTWITFWFDYERIEEAENVAETALQFTLNALCLRKRRPRHGKRAVSQKGISPASIR